MFTYSSFISKLLPWVPNIIFATKCRRCIKCYSKTGRLCHLSMRVFHKHQSACHQIFIRQVSIDCTLHKNKKKKKEREEYLLSGTANRTASKPTGHSWHIGQSTSEIKKDQQQNSQLRWYPKDRREDGKGEKVRRRYHCLSYGHSIIMSN